MKEINLSDEQKQKIVDEANLVDNSEDDGNIQIITAKEAGMFEEATARGDVKGQIARFSAMNVHARSKADILFDSANISNRNIKKAVLAACAIPDNDATIKFGGTKQQQEAAETLFYYLQTAVTTRGIALERSIKLEQSEKAKASAEQKDTDV